MNSPPCAGRSRRGARWRRWSSTGSTRNLTESSRRGWTRAPETRSGRSPASLCRREALEEIKAALAPVEWGGGRPLLHVHHALSGEHGWRGGSSGTRPPLSKVPAEWVRELVRRLPELDRRGLTFLSRPGRAGDWGTGPGAVHHPDGPPAVPVLPAGEEQQMVRFAPDFAPVRGGTSPLWRSLRGDLPGLRAAGAAGVGRGGI